jgi:hypothetical protein
VRRVASAHLLITVVLLAVLAVGGWWGGQRFGAIGWEAAGISFAVVWVAASLAIWLLAFPWSESRRLAVAMSSIFFKTLIPIAVGIALLKLRPDLESAGLAVQLVFAYLSMLLVETALSIWILDPRFSCFKNRRALAHDPRR